DGLVEFGLRADLDLNDLAWFASGESARKHSGKAAAQRDVVVLDQDSVLQIEAVVGAAAATDGVFIQRAQAGDGFVCVEDYGFGLRSSHLFDVFIGQRGDAAHALHQVEDDALGGENAGGVGADDGDG